VSRQVWIVRTGAANLASVVAALNRLGCEPRVTVEPEKIRRAKRVVLPGVGAFGPVAERLRTLGVAEALRERVAAGRPTLAVCLGMQLLAERSDESPDAPGLGVLPVEVQRFSSGVVVPQLGWNQVRAGSGCRMLEDGYAYFANSYCVDEVPKGWNGAASRHGSDFVAALERGAVLACQFHPELSGSWGERLVARWLEMGEGSAPSSPWSDSDRALGSLARRVVPCLDVAHGRVVKGVRFAGLRDAGDPRERAAAYADQDADELVLLDVAATPEGRDHHLRVVRSVREVIPLPLTVGGGVRRVADARALLEAGADKVAVNTAAVERPDLLGEMAARFGRQCTVLAVDAARNGGGWEVVVRSGRERTGRDAVRWASVAADGGAGEILLTSWDRDGTGSGYDLELVAAIRAAVSVPIIASGGAASPEHMAEALGAGADAVLAASILHDGHYDVPSIKRDLARAGVEVRQ
jgi:imidazole glycerol phosphate synthase glutamine amidotransferase subunit